MMKLNLSTMKRAARLSALFATALAAGSVIGAEPAAARADWPLWDGKESVASYFSKLMKCYTDHNSIGCHACDSRWTFTDHPLIT